MTLEGEDSHNLSKSHTTSTTSCWSLVQILKLEDWLKADNCLALVSQVSIVTAHWPCWDLTELMLVCEDAEFTQPLLANVESIFWICQSCYTYLLKLLHGFDKIFLFAKQNQPVVWPRFSRLIKLIPWVCCAFGNFSFTLILEPFFERWSAANLPWRTKRACHHNSWGWWVHLW